MTSSQKLASQGHEAPRAGSAHPSWLTDTESARGYSGPDQSLLHSTPQAPPLYFCSAKSRGLKATCKAGDIWHALKEGPQSCHGHTPQILLNSVVAPWRPSTYAGLYHLCWPCHKHRGLPSAPAPTAFLIYALRERVGSCLYFSSSLCLPNHILTRYWAGSKEAQGSPIITSYHSLNEVSTIVSPVVHRGKLGAPAGSPADPSF